MAKKGSITDLPFIIGGVFSVALVALLVSLLVININTEVQGNDEFPTNAKSASTKMSDDFPNVMDGGIVFIFFGMVIISLVLASLVPIHPVFIVFYLLEYIVLIWLGAGIANAYQAVIELDVMSAVADKYVLTTFFFRYFPFVVGVFGAILAIVMYKVKSSFIE